MSRSCCLDDPSVSLVLDASVAINVNASRVPRRILSALPNEFLIVDVVEGELDQGCRKGRKDAFDIRTLIDERYIMRVSLGSEGLEHFEKLVSGASVETLDDGESATIAYALESNSSALIDEQKAARICSERYPSLELISTVDILRHPNVEAELGTDGLRDAIWNALNVARMSVAQHHLDWVLERIGPERAKSCTSLPSFCRGK